MNTGFKITSLHVESAGARWGEEGDGDTDHGLRGREAAQIHGQPSNLVLPAIFSQNVLLSK